MLLTDEQVNIRLESPLNLVNRLNQLTKRHSTSMDIFIPGPSDRLDHPNNNPLNDEYPAANSDDEIDNIVPDNVQKIKLGIVKVKALDVLHDSLDQLHSRLPEIDRVKDYSAIARDMNDILTAEDSKRSNINQQVIVYRPIINELSKYETVIANE